MTIPTTPDWMETGRLAELGLLSSTLAHELKQPLFALKAILQISMAEAQGGHISEHHRMMLDQVRHMEDILAAYGGLVQRPGVFRGPFDPNVPARAACETLGHRATQLKVHLRADLSPHLPMLLGSVIALQQILVNLVQNALDAASEKPGSGVVVRTRPLPDGVEFCVEDDGPGIPEEDLTRVFEPFYTTKPPGRGTGLGLSIARELAWREGGSLEVTRRDPGTLARLFIPTRPRQETP